MLVQEALNADARRLMEARGIRFIEADKWNPAMPDILANWSPEARAVYDGFQQFIESRFRSAAVRDHRHRATTITRAIDVRPCDPLLPEDADWGEQDDLANVPRKEVF